MKYVNRRTFIVKRGCVDEVVAMLVEGSGDSNARIYRSHDGPFDTLAIEIEAVDAGTNAMVEAGIDQVRVTSG